MHSVNRNVLHDTFAKLGLPSRQQISSCVGFLGFRLDSRPTMCTKAPRHIRAVAQEGKGNDPATTPYRPRLFEATATDRAHSV